MYLKGDVYMKNIFGINITEDKTNTTFDGQIFHVKSASHELAATLDATYAFAKEVENKFKLPLLLRVIQTLSGIVAAIIIVGIIGGLGSVSLAQGYQNAPVIHYVAAISFVVWLLLFITSKIRTKNFRESNDYEQVLSCINRAANNMEEEFKIPPDAKDIDILSFTYKIKNGREKIISNGLISFLNLSCIVYVRTDYLHIISMREEWAIPLNSITKVEKVNKKIAIPITSWNKETPFNKGVYKKFKMTNSQAHIFFKPYYNLMIKHDGDDYKMAIPPYELDALSLLTGVQFYE